MSAQIIWIIERLDKHQEQNSAAAALLGNYAVRLFASFESFQNLMKLSKQSNPDILIVDRSACPNDDYTLTELLNYLLPTTKKVFLLEQERNYQFRNAAQAAEETALFFYQKPLDNLEFSRFIGEILFTTKKDQTIRYRNILLNLANVSCQILPDGTRQNLSPKEARLLRIFLEYPNQCLSRDRIKEDVWQDVTVSPRTIDCHVSRIRKLLQGAEAQIDCVYGGGYVLK